MALTLMVCEKSPGGPSPQEYPIELQDERLTVRELIRNIVFQQAYQQTEASREWNRVIESHEEKILNPKKPQKEGKTIDWVPRYEHALEAFENNQVLLLVDDSQVESLEDLVTVTPTTKVTFLKLIPLVGG